MINKIDDQQECQVAHQVSTSSQHQLIFVEQTDEFLGLGKFMPSQPPHFELSHFEWLIETVREGNIVERVATVREPRMQPATFDCDATEFGER